MKRCLYFTYKYGPLFIIFFVTLFLFRNVLFPTAEKIIYGGDLLTQYYFWKKYLVENLKSGTLPFWNPYSFSGTPYLAHPGNAFFYPATIFYILLPLNIAFSLLYFSHILIAGLGMYWLSRKYVDRFSSLFSSCVFILSGYFSARIFAGHLDLLMPSVWIPWVIASVKDVLELPSKRKIILAVFFLSLMILTGYNAYVLFTFEFIAFYTTFYLIKNKFFTWQKIIVKILPILLVMIISIFMTAIQWLPAWQLTKLSIRGEGLSYLIASWGSLPLSGIKLFFQPENAQELDKITYSIGGGLTTNFFDYFTGRLPIITIFIFIFFRFIIWLFFHEKNNIIRVNIDFWFFLIISIYYLWISFGFYISPNLHNLLYQLVPLYRYIRIPMQHLVFVVFLISLMLGIVVSLIKNNIAKFFLLSIFVFELFTFSSKYIFLTDIPEKKYDMNLIRYLQNEVKGERILPYFRVVSPVLEVFDFNSLMSYKIQSTSGYDPVIMKNYYDFIDINSKSYQNYLPYYYYNVEIPPLKLKKNIIDYLNVGYILTEKNSNLDSLGYKLVLEGNLYNLYQNKNTQPRFFLVNNFKIYDSLENVRKAILNEDFDFSKTVLLTKNDTGESPVYDLKCNNDLLEEVQTVSYTPNRIILKVKAHCNSLLSSSEIFYPGWKAKIGGLNTKIFQGNSAFRTIYLPKGEHKIEFYYSPDIYYLGGLISIITLIISIFVYRNQRNVVKS